MDRSKNIAQLSGINKESFTSELQKLMRQVGINSFKELYQLTGTSAHTINKLRSGEINTLQLQTLVKISSILQITVMQLIATFGVGGRVAFAVPNGRLTPTAIASPLENRSTLGSRDRAVEILQQEYQHLQQQFEQQRETLKADFQYQSLHTLESFLTYFPAAKYAAQNNPDFPASKIFPLLGSIDRLISQWGVTVIGEIGSTIAYDPRWHQLIEGTANPDELVTVRYVGYRQSDKLIFRAKVNGNSID
jgi:DNA-binding Xre family transcriptional regulator/molecular chaperone GrpE (heat shock protein)